MFENQGPIKVASLIYVGSKNNFSAKKFYEKCQFETNTLTVCLTEFNKKIGGFTPLDWNYKQNSQYKTDKQKRSFIFSLTYQDKFILQQAEKAIKPPFSIYVGPSFGEGCDFSIRDNAQQNQESYANICSSFYNENYRPGDSVSWERFCGNANGSNKFKIKEWEVWSLQFQNKKKIIQSQEQILVEQILLFKNSYLSEDNNQDIKFVNLQTIETALKNRLKIIDQKKQKQLFKLQASFEQNKISLKNYQQQKESIKKWFNTQANQISYVKKNILKGFNEAKSILAKSFTNKNFQLNQKSLTEAHKISLQTDEGQQLLEVNDGVDNIQSSHMSLKSTSPPQTSKVHKESSEANYQSNFLASQLQQSKRKKGIKTNLSVVKDYLKRFCRYVLRTCKNVLTNMNIPMGPTAAQNLKYMRQTQTDEQISDDSQEIVTLIVPINVFDTFEKSLLFTLQFDKYYDNEDKEFSRVNFLKLIMHIHNKALFDALNQNLNHERPFGIWGKPFPWKKSSAFERNFSQAEQEEKFNKSAQKVVEACSYVCGLMVDKEQSLIRNAKVSSAYIQQIRQDRISMMLANDMVENEERWMFYDDQEAEVMFEITNTIYHRLLMEFVLEIQRITIKKNHQQMRKI